MNERRKKPEELRSHRWYGAHDLRSFGHRSRTKQMGYSAEDYAGKPIIGIINTWSDLNPCHSHFKDRVDAVKRGVWQAGGFPVELPALSVSEMYMKPTSMLYRNMLAMEAEEQLRAHPVDGAVLLGGCDKTIPALVMGSLSMDLPCLVMPAGPMLRGNFRGRTVGSGSDVWRYWSELRAGTIDEQAWEDLEDGIARSFGHCMTMGTASTMTSVVEAMGLTLPGAASIPAADANHPRMASACGRRIVEMVWEDLRPSLILHRDAVKNGITTSMALGGSTNAIIHIVAIAGRAGVRIELDQFDAISRRTPMIANIQPSGKYLMEDFYYAGGLPALLSRLGELLNLDCLTVNGRTLGENIVDSVCYNDDVIRPLEDPLYREGGLAILYGNLAPDGCVIKQSAADPNLLIHRGPAVVFRDYNDMAERIDSEDLRVDANSVLVLQNAGPLGGPGMPEWGMLPIPAKLLKQGVRDMVRISDGRMSGTSYGTCVLHVSPESYVGGPFALIRDGDQVELDVPGRRLALHVSEAELDRRRAQWERPEPHYTRGYGAIYASHVTQAHLGCDLECLHAGEPVPEPEIH